MGQYLLCLFSAPVLTGSPDVSALCLLMTRPHTRAYIAVDVYSLLHISPGASIPLYHWCNRAMTNFGGVLFKNRNLILKTIYQFTSKTT